VLAIIGLVLSIVTGGVVVAALAAATSVVSSSTALDPGCISIEGSLNSELAMLKSDVSAVEADEDSASSSRTAIATAGTDLSAIEGDLYAASGAATHDDVKSDLNTMNTQVRSVGDALTAVESHSTSSDGTAAAALSTLQGTDANLDALCAAY
jgi:hypothetical protein